MKSIRTVLMAAMVAVSVFAADADGTWKAKYETPDGQTRESTFVLKADGEKLTGTLKTAMGESQIQDGKVQGSNVSFNVMRNFGGNEVMFKYAGTITGNDMKLKVSAGDREMDITARKE